MASTNRVAWDESLFGLVADFLDVPRGDAQGIVEARQGEVDAAYARGETPEQVAELVAGVGIDDPASVLPIDPVGGA